MFKLSFSELVCFLQYLVQSRGGLTEEEGAYFRDLLSQKDNNYSFTVKPIQETENVNN